MIHGVVDEGRVHHDVAVVGDKQIGAAGLELFDAGIGYAVGRALDGVVDVVLDLVLQGGYRSHAGELAPQSMSYKRFEQPAEGAGKAREAEVGEDI